MISDEVKHVTQLVNQCDNPFLKVNLISKSARQLRKKCLYVISESEAISWICSGKQPKDLDKRIKLKKEDQNRLPYSSMEDILFNIDDKDIRKAVKDSLVESIRIGQLVYIYDDIADEFKQVRVRIICNIAWDERE